MQPIYFDFNATTPLAPEAAAAMRAVLEGQFGNASCLHWAGARTREVVETARRQVASLLRCEPAEIVFTSGGTEANNSALTGVFFRQSTGTRRHFVVSSIEHPSILQTCAFLERLGAEVTRVPVDRYAVVNPDDVRRAIRADTELVSVMHSNNEVGTMQPIQEIAQIARAHNVLCHTDAAQSVGKVPVSAAALGVDLLSVAGHKLYAPQGVGVLFIRRGVQLEPFLHGAGHEQGRRAGTENILEIVGLGAACAAAEGWIHDPSVRNLRDHFWRRLQQLCGDRVALNGHIHRRLPNTLHVSFLGHHGHELLSGIPELAATTGAACHAGQEHRSSVLDAMGLSESHCLGAIRFSLGRSSTLEEVEWIAARLAELVTR